MSNHPSATLFYGMVLPDGFRPPGMKDGEDVAEAATNHLRSARNSKARPHPEIGVVFDLTAYHADYADDPVWIVYTAGFHVEYGPKRIVLPGVDTASMDEKLDWVCEQLEVAKPAEGYGWHIAATFG